MKTVSAADSLNQLNGLIAQSKITYKDLFEMHSSFDSAQVINLLDLVLDTAETDPQKVGKKMETLVNYLLENSGFIQNTSANKKNKLHEIDHFGEISPHIMSYLNSKGIPWSNFVGESKNYASSLNVDKIYKLESIKLLTKSKLGAYFTKFGLKGQIDSSAKGVLADFFHKIENVSLVFTIEDWSYLRANPQKFPALFYEKLSNFHATYDSQEIDYTNL